MSLIPGSTGRRDTSGPARVRSWVRELWGLADEDSVVVTELACAEEGCPPLETVVLIAASGQSTVQHKLHLPAADVRRDDLLALVEKEHSS